MSCVQQVYVADAFARYQLVVQQLPSLTRPPRLPGLHRACLAFPIHCRHPLSCRASGQALALRVASSGIIHHPVYTQRAIDDHDKAAGGGIALEEDGLSS